MSVENDTRAGRHRPASARRAAFTLVEILTVLILLGVLATAGVGLSPALRQRTAAQEADRLMRRLYGVMARADSRGEKFDLVVDDRSPSLLVRWKRTQTVEKLEAARGCSLTRRSSAGAYSTTIRYTPQWGTFTSAMTVRVTGTGGDAHYLILSGQGRIRTGATPRSRGRA